MLCICKPCPFMLHFGSCLTGQSIGPKAVGCLAGDAQSYILFCDFFDRIIESYHGYKVTSDAVQESDFNYDNLKV